jgi:tRNA-modifying protein YgfZ
MPFLIAPSPRSGAGHLTGLQYIERMSDLSTLARRGAVVAPHGDWETLVVTGPDRRTWLEGLVTCELKHLGPGQGTWGLVLNRQAKIQSVIWVVASPDALWLALAPGTGAAIEAELSRMLIMEDAELERPEQGRLWLALHGPKAGQRAVELAELAAGCSAPIDFTGLGGAALVVPRAREAELREACRGELLGEQDWRRLRLERGVPELGADFDGQDRPHEAALERRAVSWTKGCYLGQEVVCMQDMRGKVKRSIRALAVQAPEGALVGPGAVILNASGQDVGNVTSAAYSPLAGAWRILGRVKLDGLGGELRCAPKPSEPGEGERAAITWPARLAEPV